jgi:DNA-binding GntR family transcriptional regulator
MTVRTASPRSQPRTSLRVKRTPDDEQIYQEMLSAIIEHQVMPGARLPEEDLAQAFGVSRTRVRAVLQRLAHESLVTIRRNRGATVARLSAKEARDVFAARQILEPGATALLAERVSPRTIKSLRQFVEQEREARKSGDKRRSIALSGEFHLRLMRELNNAKLDEFLRELVSQTSLIVAVHGGADQGSCRCEEHAELLGLIAARDGKAAANCMRCHLEAIEASLRLEAAASEPFSFQEIFSRQRMRDRSGGSQ